MTQAKTLFKSESFKHPFLNKKLKSLDYFVPHKEIDCDSCNIFDTKLYIIESDNINIEHYILLKCNNCLRTKWLIKEKRKNK
jgi:hypothetical protein